MSARPRVKICGLRDVAVAMQLDGLADFAGINLVPTSRRSVSLDTAHALLDTLRQHAPDVTPILVFQDTPRHAVLQVAKELQTPWVQLHGHEPSSDAAWLAAHGCHVVKALTVADLPHAQEFLPHVHALLLDAPRPGDGQPWMYPSHAALRSVIAPQVEVWLAGGLHANNVAAAIRQAQPDLVDVASGVETAGLQDLARITAFAAAARDAAVEESL